MTGLGPEANALLDAARGGDEPTRADQERVRAAIAVRLAGSAAVGLGVAATAKSAAASAMGLATKALVAVALVGAVGAGAVMIARPRPAPPVVPVHALPAPASTTSAEPMGDIHPSARTLPAPVTAPAVASSRRAAPGTGDVAAEVRLLGEAHTAMRGGDAERALVLLDEHGRRYPKGALGEERDAARIAALCALGRVEEARDATDRFLRVAPLSPHAGPLRASCGGSPATPAP